MKFHRFYRNIFIAATDLLCVCFFLLIPLYFNYLTAGKTFVNNTFSLLIVPAVVFLINNFSGLYGGNFFYPGIGAGKVEELKRLTLSTFSGYGSLFAFLSLTGQTALFDYRCLLIALLLTLPMAPLCRFACRHLLNIFPGSRTPVLIAGAGKVGRAVALEVSKDNYYGFRVAGFLDDKKSGRDI